MKKLTKFLKKEWLVVLNKEEEREEEGGR